MGKSERTAYTFFRELPVLLVLAVLIAFVLKAYIVQPFWIPTGSMEKTLLPNDRVLALKFIYKFSEPKPGDIVVFIPPKYRATTKRDYIKRVIAVGGQKIKIVDGKVYVDGKLLNEPYLSSKDVDSGSMKEITIPKDKVFVMGDNRQNSMDSRVFGPANKTEIIGKAVLIYWPPNRIGLLR